MNDLKIVGILVTFFIAFAVIANISDDKVCIDQEMQYFNLDRREWNEDRTFGACKSDGILFHFDFNSGLTESEIKELEGRL